MAGIHRRTLLSAAVVLGGCTRNNERVSTPSRAGDPPPPQRLTYGDHPSQYVDLYLPSGSGPSGSGPWPVAVVIHGGFWRTLYGAELGVALAADLAAAGVAALNVEYRRVGRDEKAEGGGQAGGGGWPSTCADVAAAVDLLAGPGQQSAAQQLDLASVVGIGHSTGGHLVGWLATRGKRRPGQPGGDPRVNLTGFVSQAGVLDLVSGAAERLGGGAVQAFMGADPAQDAAAYALASPQAQLPIGVPSICVHGSDDTIVPIAQSEQFVAAAQAAGDDSQLIRIEGADHFAAINIGSAMWRECRQTVLGLAG